MSERSYVPCNGCGLCCKNDAIMLHPECGDKPETYQTVPFVNPLTGEPGLMLAKAPNGECIYLGASGCTIHDRAPTICREFDCGKMFKLYTLKQRQQLVASGMFGKDVLDRGRQITRIREASR